MAAGDGGRMTDTARILVIILNYRTVEMTLRAAEAALADMPQNGAELVIVDNASGDGSAAPVPDIAVGVGQKNAGVQVPFSAGEGGHAGRDFRLSRFGRGADRVEREEDERLTVGRGQSELGGNVVKQ